MTAKIIVFANEKGGTGKSTLAMHTIVALLRSGKKVVLRIAMKYWRIY